MAITTTAQHSNAAPPQACHTCRTLCQQRCQRCRSIYYCSIECQKKDWKKHRRVCKQEQASEAWKELCQIVASSTAAEANQGLHQARDEIIQQQQQIEEDKARQEREKSHRQERAHSLTSASPDVTKFAESSLPRYQGTLSYSIEKMPNLSMYQVIVYFPNAHRLTFDSCRIDIIGGSILTVQLFPSDPLVQISFPHRELSMVGQARPVDLVESNHRALYIRLVDTDQSTDSSVMDRLFVPAHDASKISCRSCRQGFFRENTIHNVLWMPSSRWEDMADYLTCLDPTNTAVEALSSPMGIGKRHHILQDTTTLVVHVEDVLDTSVCVLAVPGYGQEETLEESTTTNTWMQTRMGATLTCSQCADVIGEASNLDTFRFFHHKLCFNEHPLSTVSTFVATELVRHAETQAVYTFGIVHPTHRMLLLQLVSWESEVAYSHQSLVDSQDLHDLQWHKVTKILFYETTMTTDDASSPHLLWQTDWCCDPVTNSLRNTTNKKIIKLYLNAAEWTKLKDELTELSQKQVREIAEATIIAKTGNATSKEVRLATVLRN
ncbi:hypothetical protein FisN_6Lh110 [Fistulifera solaris]|uniref:MYND-type domain-containing protein n=1 Tax=Fistulifera solaris TaxID=1519565 RepID=A0A1Z5J6H4_FISSO|nr:hypothetical protein FisN_6Lh110 [Fistulifera solaris]|eukprot:GAX09502.1 hypothetical protein FisN_6Lh110 [Fistulifera solaris]